MFMVKFSPAALSFVYDFVLLVLFLGHPVCHHKPNQRTCLPQNSKKSLRLEYLHHTQRPFLPLKQLVGLLSTYTFNHIFLSREYCCAVLHFWVLYSLHLLSTEIPFLQAGSCQCWLLPFLLIIVSANDHFHCSHWILSTSAPLCRFSLTWSLLECRLCSTEKSMPDLNIFFLGHWDHGKSRQDSPPCESDEGLEDLQACPIFHSSSVPHVYSESGTYVLGCAGGDAFKLYWLRLTKSLACWCSLLGFVSSLLRRWSSLQRRYACFTHYQKKHFWYFKI